MPALDQVDTTELYPLKVIKNNKEYEMALKSMEDIFDETESPLAEYAETLTILIEHYEEEHFPVKNAQGVDIVKFLMEQNGLKQKDLVGVLGGKSTVSEILNGKRPINLNHIRILADKFHVKPATFV
ncbi:MAG: helix-turn-helix domain-containing protein [Deltaproteobacteria bacterium]|nr:helix-turn-helix domain-containing protein [Deltaproteobacteria bacterium]